MLADGVLATPHVLTSVPCIAKGFRSLQERDLSLTRLSLIQFICKGLQRHARSLATARSLPVLACGVARPSAPATTTRVGGPAPGAAMAASLPSPPVPPRPPEGEAAAAALLAESSRSSMAYAACRPPDTAASTRQAVRAAARCQTDLAAPRLPAQHCIWDVAPGMSAVHAETTHAPLHPAKDFVFPPDINIPA